MVAPHDAAEPGTARWWLSHHGRDRRLRRDATLSVSVIVAEALRVVEREGVESLTMRRVADELNVNVSSLYGHVESRDEIVALLGDEVLAVLDAQPPPDLSWRDAMEWLILRFIAYLDEHPRVAPLVRTPLVFGPRSLAARERALRILIPAGFDVDQAMTIYVALAVYAVGAVRGLVVADDAMEIEARRDLYASDESRPLLRDHASTIGETTMRRAFVAGLGLILDGVEHRRTTGWPDLR